MGILASGFFHSLRLAEHFCQVVVQGRPPGIISVHLVPVADVRKFKIRNGQPLQVFIHVKCGIFCIEAAKQHQTQREGADNRYRPLFIPAQVCPGHGEGGHFPGLPAFPPGFSSAAIGVAYCFHRGNPGGHPARFSAGKQYRE